MGIFDDLPEEDRYEDLRRLLVRYSVIVSDYFPELRDGMVTFECGWSTSEESDESTMYVELYALRIRRVQEGYSVYEGSYGEDTSTQFEYWSLMLAHLEQQILLDYYREVGEYIIEIGL